MHVFFSAFDPQHLFPRLLCKGCFIKLLATSIIYHDLMLIRAKTTSCASKDMKLTSWQNIQDLDDPSGLWNVFLLSPNLKCFFHWYASHPNLIPTSIVASPLDPTVPLVSFVHSGGSRKRSSSPVQRPDLRTAPWAAFDSKQHQKNEGPLFPTNPEPAWP